MNLVVSISGRRNYNVKRLPSSLDEQPPSSSWTCCECHLSLPSNLGHRPRKGAELGGRNDRRLAVGSVNFG